MAQGERGGKGTMQQMCLRLLRESGRRQKRKAEGFTHLHMLLHVWKRRAFFRN